MKQFAIVLSIIILGTVAVTAQGNDLIQSIQVSPSDTSFSVGDSFQFTAVVTDTNEAVVDTTVGWTVSGGIGDIAEDGTFSATTAGSGYVIAQLGALADSASVTVSDTAVTEVVNTATIQRYLPSGKLHNKTDQVQEGSGEYKFSGFPAPLNFLNGGRLMFPEGSLHEDISITIKLPTFANIQADSVYSFEHGDSTKVIASSAEFIVTVNGDTVSPYYFDIPISVSLPYKKGLLAELGLTPENLGMGFFNQGGEIDTTSIANAYVDDTNNRIIADVAHFSTIVLFSEKSVTSIADGNDGMIVPDGFALKQNYPNPFNPDTNIDYYMPHSGRVSLVIYNILGQKVRTLLDREMTAGLHQVRWDGRNSAGVPVSGGVYFYKMTTGKTNLTRKMLLLK